MGSNKKKEEAKVSTELYDKPITPFKPTNIEYLVIQGAGGKGAAYLGALKAIEDLEILKTTDGKGEKKEVLEFKQLKGIAGTSAGTITALMLSLGYSANETNEMVVKNPLFLLALGEKSQLSRYRAYKGTSDRNGNPEIGFIYLKSNKYKSKVNQAKQSLLQDKYTLSNAIIDGFNKQKKGKIDDPNIIEGLDLNKFLKKTSNKISNKLNSLMKKAMLSGLLKSLTEPVILENIANEVYDEFLEEYNSFKKARKTLKKGNEFLSENYGFNIDLLTTLFDSIEEILDNAFSKWNEDKINGVRNISYGYAILIGILLLKASSLLVIQTKIKVADGGKPCSSEEEANRKRLEKWGYIKTMSKLIWHSNIPNIPIITPILESQIEIGSIIGMDFKNDVSTKDLRAVNKSGKNLSKELQNLSNIFEMLQSGDIKTIAKSIGANLVKSLPKLIKPLQTILSEGGLLDGCRVRFIFTKLIYEKVEVIIDAKDDFKFKRRKKDLTKEVLENLETIFHQEKKIKSLKTLKKERDNYIKEYIGFKNDKLLSLKDIAEFLAKLTKFIYVNFNSDKSDNTTIINFINDLSLEEKALKKSGDKIDDINQLIGLYEMREHLKIIERHYNFEEHKKLFNHYLVICSANITSGVSSYFNAELTPDFSIVEASGMSMNIPGLWKPVAVDYMPKKGQGRLINETDTDEAFYQKYYYGWFVDGGISENIPLFAFNGYPTGDEKIKDGVATRSPEEMAQFNEEFPKGKILGISNFGGKCKDKENYKGGQDAKDDKEQAVWREEAFDINKKSFLSVGGDIFSSFFEYPYKLRGFEIEPYKSHILTVDYGFMGMFDFAANINELIRVEENNYIKTALFFGDEEKAKNPKVINDPKKLDKDGRKRWKKSRVNQKNLYRKPFFSKLK